MKDYRLFVTEEIARLAERKGFVLQFSGAQETLNVLNIPFYCEGRNTVKQKLSKEYEKFLEDVPNEKVCKIEILDNSEQEMAEVLMRWIKVVDNFKKKEESNDRKKL